MGSGCKYNFNFINPQRKYYKKCFCNFVISSATMNLIIDVGNSFVKLAVFQQDELLTKIIAKKEHSHEDLVKLLISFPDIQYSIFSNVGRNDINFSPQLKNIPENLILGSSVKLPFLNLYATPETLGNDRKALVAAAATQFSRENTLIVDAGTCLTFDFKNKKNEYLGGAISPGLKMRYKAVNKFTANLPFLDPATEIQLIGTDTQSSIHSGVINGMAKEIDGIIDEYKAEYENLTIIFTGGDAQFLSGSLKNVIFANSNFLLEGLNYILKFNIIQ